LLGLSNVEVSSELYVFIGVLIDTMWLAMRIIRQGVQGSNLVSGSESMLAPSGFPFSMLLVKLPNLIEKEGRN